MRDKGQGREKINFHSLAHWFTSQMAKTAPGQSLEPRVLSGPIHVGDRGPSTWLNPAALPGMLLGVVPKMKKPGPYLSLWYGMDLGLRNLL